MAFDRKNSANVARLATIINNDSTEYNIGISFSLSDTVIADALNLARDLDGNGDPVVAGKDFITGFELLEAVGSGNVSNNSGDQAMLQFIGAITGDEGTIPITKPGVLAALKGAFANPVGSIIDALQQKTPASIGEVEWGVGTVIRHIDVATAEGRV